MKFETIRSVIKVKLFAAAMLAAGLFASAGYAQTTFSGKFTLPYEVQWGKNVLPAGQYFISMHAVGATAIVQSEDGKIAFYTPIPIQGHKEKGKTALKVLARGNDRIVLSLNLPERGLSLVYRPTTAAERELIARADRESTVPLTTAKK
jgi:hypothetical protein